jgi:hypothetical protein
MSDSESEIQAETPASTPREEEVEKEYAGTESDDMDYKDMVYEEEEEAEPPEYARSAAGAEEDPHPASDSGANDDTPLSKLGRGENLSEVQRPAPAPATKFVLQYGPHRNNYRVGAGAFVHTASTPLEVADGETIGRVMSSKSGKIWSGEGFRYSQVHIIGGEDKDGKMQSAPYVCFKPPAGTNTDDELWLRLVPATVMSGLQPAWKKYIASNWANDTRRRDCILGKYAAVLDWSPENTAKRAIDPELFSDALFKLDTSRKLTSIRKNPVAPPRAAARPSQPNKLVSPIAKAAPKGGKGAASSSSLASDAESEATLFANARTLRLGPKDQVATFEVRGVIYATVVAEE